MPMFFLGGGFLFCYCNGAKNFIYTIYKKNFQGGVPPLEKFFFDPPLAPKVFDPPLAFLTVPTYDCSKQFMYVEERAARIDAHCKPN